MKCFGKALAVSGRACRSSSITKRATDSAERLSCSLNGFSFAAWQAESVSKDSRAWSHFESGARVSNQRDSTSHCTMLASVPRVSCLSVPIRLAWRDGHAGSNISWVGGSIRYQPTKASAAAWRGFIGGALPDAAPCGSSTGPPPAAVVGPPPRSDDAETATQQRRYPFAYNAA